MKFTPSTRVYVLGAILCVALTICSRNWGDRGGPPFLASLAVAGIAYLLAIREFLSTPGFPRRVVVIGDTPLDIRCGRAIGAKVRDQLQGAIAAA